MTIKYIGIDRVESEFEDFFTASNYFYRAAVCKRIFNKRR